VIYPAVVNQNRALTTPKTFLYSDPCVRGSDRNRLHVRSSRIRVPSVTSSNGVLWVTTLAGASVALVGLFTPNLARATHEVNHRFIVSGTVSTPEGVPRQDVKVVVTHPKNQLSETVFTDRTGSYSVLLHLHDQDAGDTVIVTAGDEVKTIKAAYDPLDHHTPRTARVDFGPVTDESSNVSGWWYGLGGVLVACGMWYWRSHTRNQRREASRKGARPASSSRRK